MVEFILAFVFSFGPVLEGYAYLNTPEVIHGDPGDLPYFVSVQHPRVGSDLNGYYIFAGAGPQDTHAIKQWLSQELAIYPKEIISFAKVSYILSTQDLFTGTPGKLERWGGLADLSNKVLYLDIKTFSSKSLHHELFHFIDDRSGFHSQDVEWASLNGPGFRYTHSYSLKGKDYIQGFASEYATCNAGEDKAETFAWMMTYPYVIEHRVANDPVLARKVNCLKSRLLSICPEINETFWKRISKQRTNQLISEYDQQRRERIEKLRNQPERKLNWIEARLRQTFVAVEQEVHSPLESLSSSVKFALLLIALVTPLSVVLMFCGSRHIASQ